MALQSVRPRSAARNAPTAPPASSWTDPAQVAERVRLHWAIKTKITRLFLEIGQYTQNGAVDSTRWISQISIQSA
jgi:hypothetical protein